MTDTTMSDAIIAGGGPTGLMLAGELALAGVGAIIVERRSSQALAGSRAGAQIELTPCRRSRRKKRQVLSDLASRPTIETHLPRPEQESHSGHKSSNNPWTRS